MRWWETFLIGSKVCSHEGDAIERGESWYFQKHTQPRGTLLTSTAPPANRPVSSSLDHLVAGSQGVITKRIDLALIEGQELLSHTLQRAALVGFGMVLAAGAWFAVAACLVLHDY